MSQACNQPKDFLAVDLRPHFRWRWQEHGIYLGVCSVFVAIGTALALVPPSVPGGIAPQIVEVILSRYQQRVVVEEKPGRGAQLGRFAIRAPAGTIEGKRFASASKAGFLGMLGPGTSRTLGLFGRDTAAGSDPADVLGGLVGNNIGEAPGAVGLGLVGTGAGGSGYGRGAIGDLGHRLARAAPTVARSLPPMVAPSLPALDPNGRFATTYRPGRGHLAWFDAALARNDIPPSVRQLVGDFGSRYAPDMPSPRDRALVQRVDVERTALPPAGGPLQLRITLRSSDRAPGPRPQLSVHVVLDVSGSMSGAPLEHARSAVEQLLALLHPADRFSLTTFASSAEVVVPDGTVGPRRQQIAEALRHIAARDSTNMSAGLALGYGEARRKPLGPEWVTLVMLLSDGQPNQGVVWPAALAAHAAEAFQAGVQTSAFGVGDNHDGVLMAAIAERGAGGYYYLPHSEAIAAALGAELQSRLQPVAQAVEVRVRLKPDVRLVDTHGSRKLDQAESTEVREQERTVDAQVAVRDKIRRDRVRDVEGGMRFFIPGFSRDDRHVILLGLDLPGGLGTRDVATVELHYKDRLTSENVSQTTAVQVRYADSDIASARTIDPSVAATVQGFAAGETLLAAAQWIGSVEESRGRSLLAERAELMRKAAVALREPRLAGDARRVDDLRALISQRRGVQDPLLVAQLLTTSGLGLLH